MNKGIGFNRNIHLAWLDAAAALCGETADPVEIRARLESVVSQDLTGVNARRMSVDILLNVWLKSGEVAPDLHAGALKWFQSTAATGDRIWLHYGLTLLYYPFFRACAVVIGQISRQAGAVTTRLVKQRLAAERGALGSLDRSVQRVVASLRNWGVLAESEPGPERERRKRHAYTPRRQAFPASSVDLEAWLLACALRAHPAEELPFADLLRLPELFPFSFTLSVDHLRAYPGFVVQRQGAGWDTVRMAALDTA